MKGFQRGLVTVVYLIIALALEGVSVIFQWRADHGNEAAQDGEAAKPPVVHEQGAEGSSKEPSR